MGTQQILMIVLSVIIVGIAVAVGIQMFQTQQTSAEVQAVAADLQNYGAQAVGFLNATTSQGGLGGTWVADKGDAAGLWLGWGDDNVINDNATYTIETAANSATITASGTDNANGSNVVIGDDGELTVTIAND